jgi:GTP-binding protein HflX
MEALSADFTDAEVVTSSANGRVLAYLAAHAEIYRQTYDDDKVVLRCYIPKHLLHHVEGPDVRVRLLGNGEAT